MSLKDFLTVGRSVIPGGRIANVTTVATEIIQQNAKRQVLIISPPSAGVVTIFPDPSISDRTGLIMRWDGMWLWLSAAKDGGIVRERFFAILETGEGPVTDRWTETTNAVNAQVVATRAAVINRRHRLHGFAGSFDAAGVIGRLRTRINGVTVFDSDLHEQASTSIEGESFESAANENAEAILVAGGAGVTGRINLWGTTIDAGDGGANVGIIEGLTDPSLDEPDRKTMV